MTDRFTIKHNYGTLIYWGLCSSLPSEFIHKQAYAISRGEKWKPVNIHLIISVIFLEYIFHEMDFFCSK